MITTKAVMDSLPEVAGGGPAAVLSRFRADFHACLTARADELCELADAVLCADRPVRNLAALSLAPEHRRGHGALYDAVNHGRIDIARLRRSLSGLPLPRAADGRLMLAVDVSNWLRPGAATSPDRLFYHVYGRGKGQAQMIPGWPYSVIAALEPGRTSWTAVLDAIRLGPDDDEGEVTAVQVRNVIGRLIDAGHWREGDLPILVIFDAGYDPMRLAYQLAGLPVEILGRLRSDRVLHFPVPARQPGTNGRPPRHGREFTLAGSATWPAPPVATTTETTRYGSGHGLAVRLARSGVVHLTGSRPAQPLSGMRCISRQAFDAVQPLARGWGVETALIVDILRKGYRIDEVPTGFHHRVTGRSFGAQVHRARQFRDVAIALALRYMRGLPPPGNRKPWYGC